MVKHPRATTHVKLKTLEASKKRHTGFKTKWLANALRLSNSLERVKSRSPKRRCYSSKLFHNNLKKIPLSPHMEPIWACSTISNDIEMEPPVQENREFQASLTPSTTQQPKSQVVKLPLLARLSEPTNWSQTQTTEKSTRNVLASTMKPCHGMKQRVMKPSGRRKYPLPYRKPNLFSRISLGMSNEPEPICSTVEEAIHSSRNPNGSTFSLETPSTLTMSSLISTPSHKKIENQFQSARISNCFMDHPCPPKQSRPMVTGSLPGRRSLMPPCSSSSTVGSKFNHMEGTSNDILLPFHYSSTPALLTMTEQSESELPREETWSSQILPNSPISEFSGLTYQVPLLQRLSDPPTSDNSRHQTEDCNHEMHAVAGMTKNVPTLPPRATMHMSASTVEVMPTSERTAQLYPRNKLSQQWQSRPKYARDFIWCENESPRATTASITETAPPL